MGSTFDNGGDRGQDSEESWGVLAGWTHRDMNGRLDVRLQTVRSTRRDGPDDPDLHHIVMSKSQAAVLATYLFKIAGAKPPRQRRRGILGKLLEG